MGAQKLLRGHDASASLRHPQTAPGRDLDVERADAAEVTGDWRSSSRSPRQVGVVSAIRLRSYIEASAEFIAVSS